MSHLTDIHWTKTWICYVSEITESESVLKESGRRQQAPLTPLVRFSWNEGWAGQWRTSVWWCWWGVRGHNVCVLDGCRSQLLNQLVYNTLSCLKAKPAQHGALGGNNGNLVLIWCVTKHWLENSPSFSFLLFIPGKFSNADFKYL